LKQDIKDGIASGIGNYLLCEILYRAKISPHRQMADLSDHELTTLANMIKYVTKLCYMANTTGYMKKLADFIPKHVEKVEDGIFPNYHPEVKIKKGEVFEFMVYGRKSDDYGNEVQADKIVDDRTTYWVPVVQV
jgi:hypothetical protein